MILVKRFEFSDDDRKAIAEHLGNKGKASRKLIDVTIDTLVEAWLRDLRSEVEENNESR